MDQGLLRRPLPAGSLDPVWARASRARRSHPLGRDGDRRAMDGLRRRRDRVRHQGCGRGARGPFLANTPAIQALRMPSHRGTRAAERAPVSISRALRYRWARAAQPSRTCLRFRFPCKAGAQCHASQHGTSGLRAAQPGPERQRRVPGRPVGPVYQACSRCGRKAERPVAVRQGRFRARQCVAATTDVAVAASCFRGVPHAGYDASFDRPSARIILRPFRSRSGPGSSASRT